MSSTHSDSLWREGLNMDSSIFSDDDFLDWRWPAASSPKRCDRECANGMRGILGKDDSTRPSSCSCSMRSSSSNREELFFYCTEELGSESTSGVADLCVASNSYNFSINEKRTSSFTTAPNTSSNRNFYACLFDSMEPFSSSSRSASVIATTSGRSAYDGCKHQACASSKCIKTTSHNLEVEGASSSSTNISSHAHIFDSNAPHHHHHHHRHCGAVSGDGNRNFPPPILSLLTDRPLMRSFKSNGRFILKKVDNVSRSLFRSTRKNGRLRLELLPSSFDCLESQYALFFPASSPLSPAFEDAAAESTSTPDLMHDSDHDLESTPYNHWLSTLSPYSILHHKPTLNCETLCPPSKLQAIAMLMNSKGPCSPLVEESISTSSTCFKAGHLIKGQTGGNTAMVQPTPHVFAVLKLLPSGLGLIIFEIGKSKGGDHITLYGMYILKDFGFQCSRAAMSPSHHLLTNSFGISSTEGPKGKLFPFEDCKKERYT